MKREAIHPDAKLVALLQRRENLQIAEQRKADLIAKTNAAISELDRVCARMRFEAQHG